MTAPAPPPEHIEPDLAPNRRDKLVALVKGISGVVPVAGPILAEIVGQVIPDQRIDRIANFLTELAKRLNDVETQILDQRLRTPEGISLLEEGFIQASKAATAERRGYLAALVAYSIRDNKRLWHEASFFMLLLADVSDAELIILRFNARNISAEVWADFRSRHTLILEPWHIPSGSQQLDAERRSIRKARYARLVRLGLLEEVYQTEGEIGERRPKFDSWSGRPEISGHRITPVGSRLLQLIDQTPQSCDAGH